MDFTVTYLHPRGMQWCLWWWTCWVLNKVGPFHCLVLKSAYGPAGGATPPFHPYHLQSNSCTKWVNSILEQYVCRYVNYHQDERVPLLPLEEFVYNSNAWSYTQQTPFYMWYGCDYPATLEVIQGFSPGITPFSIYGLYICFFRSSWKKHRLLTITMKIDVCSQHWALCLQTVFDCPVNVLWCILLG